uniref:IS629 protein n=1 Tax=Salmonella dublin TaxID=98360 RepID=F5BQE9_SALDU|nr:IS629 protein [Salmonella enterica subsp. enterica serovar Dublin]
MALFALQPFQRQTGRHIVKDTHFLMKRRNNSGKFLSQYPGRFLLSEPRQPGGCKLKTAPVRPVVAARPAEYVCSEDLFY